MSDFKSISVQELCKEYPYLDIYIHKLQKKIQDLENNLTEIKKYYQSFDKFASTVYDPNKSTYRELEDKLKNFEIDKNREIDELWATKIKPLREKIEQYEKSLELTQTMSVNDGLRIRELEQLVKDQDNVISYIVGYLSACEQFRDKHPLTIKTWFFSGWKDDLCK